MSILSDLSLRTYLESGRLVCTPLDDDAVQGASLDIRLGGSLTVFTGVLVDPLIDQTWWWKPVVLDAKGAWTLVPGRLYLGSTVERITVPDDLAAELFGVSSLGRCGVAVHQTAGWIDSGFSGELTLELSVLAAPTVLRPGQRIGQLVFHQLTTPSQRPYGERGIYQGQVGPTPARIRARGVAGS